jgi:hypothetical protein
MSIKLNISFNKTLTDWDHEGCESVTTDDTSVIHNILGCDLTIGR